MTSFLHSILFYAGLSWLLSHHQRALALLRPAVNIPQITPRQVTSWLGVTLFGFLVFAIMALVGRSRLLGLDVGGMKIHTVFITYNRLDLTKQALASYLDTVAMPYTYLVVDNCSTDGTNEWLNTWDHPYQTLTRNRYPGYAANIGWEQAPDDATHLHRADNDFIFLKGWCEEVERIFQNPKIGQLGLRTDEEERFVRDNTGGNCIIRRDLFDAGLRYDERPWPELRDEVGAGHTEDSLFSPEVKRMGYTWTRVKRPCIQAISPESAEDPYYRQTWRDRGIVRS